jgi:hypothetical protein
MAEDNPTAVRAIALAEAVKFAGQGGDPDAVVGVANIFLGFLNDEGDQAAAAPVKATPAKTPAKATPAKTPAKTPPKEEPEGPTRDDIEAKVQELLGANKRGETVALMKKFKAKSVSTLPVEHYAAFVEEADAILMTG